MKTRGSAMIFAVVMVVAMTSIVVATVWLSSSLVRDERIQEDQAAMGLAFEGATEQTAQDFTAGTLGTLPVNRTITINGVPCVLSVTDNSANVPHTMLISGTMSKHGRTVTVSKVVGKRSPPSPFYYSLFVNSGFTYTGALNTGSSSINGDVYANGNTILAGLGTINGNFESTGSISLGTEAITGTQYTNASAVTFPSVSSANYSTVANQTVSKGNLGTTTFSTTSGAYWLIYCTGNTSIGGTFTGKGTIFVNGNATISSPITYGNSSSRVAIIASGSVTFSLAASGTSSGYFYGSSLSLPATGITLNKGAIVVGSLSSLAANLTVINDAAVWLDSTEGTKHRLPGYYP